jgi:hypothetical protein
MLTSLGPRGGDYLSTCEPPGRPTQRESQRDPDTMDVDTVAIGEGDRTGWRERGRLSKVERKKQPGRRGQGNDDAPKALPTYDPEIPH